MIDPNDMLCKDAFSITSRLFDHRAVVKAECKYIVTELELKKNRETFKTTHSIVPIAEGTGPRIDQCISLMEKQLPYIHDSAVGCASSCLDVLSCGDEKIKEKKEEYEKKRDAEWSEFVAEMNKAREEVCEKHKTRMAELETA